MTSRSTIAIWCEKIQHAGETTAEFHVNVWHFSRRNQADFFELGIMPKDPSSIECVRIFIPVHLNQYEIEDLGPSFKSIEVAQGIFNEPLSCTTSDDGRCVELREDERIYCLVHVFSMKGNYIDEDEMTIEVQAEGTVLTITRKALVLLSRRPTKGAGYFRLRVTPKRNGITPFLTEIKPKDRAWNSGYDVIEYIDCRMNEARTLPMSVEAAFKSAQYGVAKTRLIAFLAVVPIASSVTSSHTEWHKSRLLEREIWGAYVPHGLDNGMVVYHWKKRFGDIHENRFASFSAFVKMQTRKSDEVIIGLYLLAAFVIGAIGSFAASLFQKFLL